MTNLLIQIANDSKHIKSMIKSKFRIWILLLILLFTTLCVLYCYLCMFLFFPENEKQNELFIPFSIVTFTILWLFFGEIRTKAIVVNIVGDKIIYKRFFGLSSPRTKYFKDFDGYKTSILYSRSGSYEYLYLMIKGKKVIKLSEFYHNNYQDLKKKIDENLKYKGFEEYNHLRELKETFS